MMIGQIASFMLILYLLFLFPVLLGCLFIGEKEKDVCLSYLYGMVVSLGVFLLEAFVFWYFDGSLKQLAYAYGGTAAVLSIVSLILLMRSKSRPSVPFLYRYHYLMAGIITLLFVGLRQDTAKDDVLENALTHLALNKICGFSPYSGIEMVGGGVNGLLPAFYAVLSQLSDVHVTMIGKLIMPFAAAIMGLTAHRLLIERFFKRNTKDSWWALWAVIYLWIFFCFKSFPSYRVLWEAPWTPQCLIGVCFMPLFIYFFVKKKWDKRFSALLAAIILIIFFGADVWMKNTVQRFLPVLAVGLLFIGIFRKKIMWFFRYCINFCTKKGIQNICISILAAVFAIASIIFKACIIADSTYAMPDNRYKMDAEVMQIRMLVEPIEPVKMLAPPEVLAQIRDGDLKVSLPFGPEMEKITEIEGLADVRHITRQVEIAEDLALNEYEPLKMIQHGKSQGCNVIVSYRDEENEQVQEELFLQQGFCKIGETASYEVYEYLCDTDAEDGKATASD